MCDSIGSCELDHVHILDIKLSKFRKFPVSWIFVAFSKQGKSLGKKSNHIPYTEVYEMCILVKMYTLHHQDWRGTRLFLSKSSLEIGRT